MDTVLYGEFIMFIETIEQYLSLEKSKVILQGTKNIKVVIPCVNALIVKRSLVRANNWNPNSVSDDKMELLRQSIVDNGFCFPVVTGYSPDAKEFIIVDGFHRYTITGESWLNLQYVPIVVIDRPISELMAATWQFNKARGVHQVDLDADLIRALIQQGMGEEEVSRRLGIDIDTIFRYKQMTGLAELFRGTEYSMSWEIAEVNDEMAVR
jgi:hypothetical protein